MIIEYQTVLTWVEYNINWIRVNWEALVSIYTYIVAIASTTAAIFPNKDDSSFINKIHNFINTDKLHSIVNLLALNVNHVNRNLGTKK